MDPVLQGRTPGAPRWGDAQALSIVVFSPKGGVGKTTVAANLAAALQTRRGKSVLLIDADTVTGHVTTSLAMEGVRTVVDSWTDEAEGGPPETLAEVSSLHPSGMRVVPLTSSPLDTEILDPARVRAQVAAVRTSFDVIVVDLHPSYSALNQAIFEEADRILVPVTPDVPAIRAAVQLRDVAARLGCRERLAMVINRANSGVTVADMERTVGMPALALIRSGGLLFVRAANEGRTVIDMFPKEKISTDFEVLGDRVLGNPTIVPAARGLRFPSRARSESRQSRRSSAGPGSLSAAAIGPAHPAQRSTRQRLGALARSGIDLLDPAQIRPVDEDDAAVRLADRDVPQRHCGLNDRDEHLRRTIEQPVGLISRIERDAPDDAVRWHLEPDVVVDLVDSIARSARRPTSPKAMSIR